MSMAVPAASYASNSFKMNLAVVLARGPMRGAPVGAEICALMMLVSTSSRREDKQVMMVFEQVQTVIWRHGQSPQELFELVR